MRVVLLALAALVIFAALGCLLVMLAVPAVIPVLCCAYCPCFLCLPAVFACCARLLRLLGKGKWAIFRRGAVRQLEKQNTCPTCGEYNSGKDRTPDSMPHT